MNNSLLKHLDGDDPGGWSEPAALDRRRTAKVGLRVLLAVVSSLFFLFLIAFIARSQLGDWQALTDPLAPLASTGRLWLNTTLLVVASAGLQWARYSARRDDHRAALLGMLIGAAFAIAFLIGQLLVWQQFTAWGYGVSGNPANSFFFLLTGLHGAHLLGGLVALGWTFTRLHGQAQRAYTGIDLCATYWHYLLALWLLLFALLTSTPATYQAIAAFCGLR
ncbi:cytochrome c oxidase subunit 3 [Pseudomonas jinjuensis]|uniref:Cytochrome c oxidase subunit 3 n=1 Tax=Pseudomonas jinjuensis TaxID=198616 RepID=A0A1H0D087_9PSED|nr:cytochrome c oxidase subunit 3 [Pseudomonas jinjuensis]SDN63564.1 cytochrome c oxidase subunit 3 [Pseudomonas jinjuensis]